MVGVSAGILVLFPHAQGGKFRYLVFPHALGKLSQASRTSCVCFHSTFLVVGFIFPWMGCRFCNVKDWIGFPHIFGAAGAFSTHVFLQFHMFLPWL